jgi:hypothetical protein
MGEMKCSYKMLVRKPEGKGSFAGLGNAFANFLDFIKALEFFN